MYELRDAFIICIALSSEAALFFLALSYIARSHGFARLRFVLAPAILCGAVLGIIVSVSPRSSAIKALLPHLDNIRFYFAIFLIAIGLLLRTYHGPSAPAAPGRFQPPRLLIFPILVITCFFCLLPESTAVFVKIARLDLIEDRELKFKLAIATGILAPLTIAAFIESAANQRKITSPISISLVFCALFAIKTAGATIWTLGMEPVAIRFMQFISNIFHDMFHIFFVMFHLPDHPFLKNETYQGILYFLSPFTHAVVVAIIATVALLSAQNAFFKRPFANLLEIPREPDRRIARVAFMRSNSRAVAIVVFSAAVVWSGTLIAEHIQSEALLDPVPQPVTNDGKGFVIIPLESMMGDTIPSQMRKYSYSAEGKTIVFMVIKKQDGAITVALDMCLICQPRGYAQIDSLNLLCKYCKTPIPVSTVGVPGGCNPIPVQGAMVKEQKLRIPVEKLIKTYKYGMKGKRG